MEHREPPRIAPGDRRFDGAAEETRWRDSGCALLTVADTGARSTYGASRSWCLPGWRPIAGCVYLGTWATRAAVGWLAISRISDCLSTRSSWSMNAPPLVSTEALEPFSKRCARGSSESDHVSFLNFRPMTWRGLQEICLGRAGGQGRVRPGRIRVELPYRQPVAWVQLREERPAHSRRGGRHSPDGRHRRGGTWPISIQDQR